MSLLVRNESAPLRRPAEKAGLTWKGAGDLPPETQVSSFSGATRSGRTLRALDRVLAPCPPLLPSRSSILAFPTPGSRRGVPDEPPHPGRQPVGAARGRRAGGAGRRRVHGAQRRRPVAAALGRCQRPVRARQRRADPRCGRSGGGARLPRGRPGRSTRKLRCRCRGWPRPRCARCGRTRWRSACASAKCSVVSAATGSSM
jgi:hypothetical protein